LAAIHKRWASTSASTSASTPASASAWTWAAELSFLFFFFFELLICCFRHVSISEESGKGKDGN
jgi:hypothetical protein